MTSVADFDNVQYTQSAHDKYFKEPISKLHLHHEDVYMMCCANGMKDMYYMKYIDKAHDEQCMCRGRTPSEIIKKREMTPFSTTSQIVDDMMYLQEAINQDEKYHNEADRDKDKTSRRDIDPPGIDISTQNGLGQGRAQSKSQRSANTSNVKGKRKSPQRIYLPKMQISQNATLESPYHAKSKEGVHDTGSSGPSKNNG